MRCKAIAKERNIYINRKSFSGSNTVLDKMTSVSKFEITQLAKFIKTVMDAHKLIISETKEGRFLLKRNKVSIYGRNIKPNLNTQLFFYLLIICLM